jgi:predicted Rossmann fold flavoprotein
MKVLVVGGGAAGLIAAWRAASLGADVTLLEKGKRLGTKILISGGGKCNVTHAGPLEDIRKAFRPNEAGFLKPSFYKFTNTDFTKLLTDSGMELYTRPDGRIFPVAPADAGDVVEVLENLVRRAGVKIWLEAPATELLAENKTMTGVRLGDGKVLEAGRVVLATGGSSYPATGCTGDGWRWAEALGHTLVRLTAALAPLYLDPLPPEDRNGVPLRGCLLKARKLNPDGMPGKERMRWRGDLVFTYKGVSGPVALGVSREIAEALPDDSLVEADFLPDEPLEKLTERLLVWTRENPRKSIAAFVDSVVPERLVGPVLASAGVEATSRGAYLTAKDRNRLALTLKGWSLGRVRAVPLERGEVVAGGVALSEVDSRTMRSRKVSGLWLCGEILDIAGPVGGYNLQAAWSTGFVAGEDAAG